MILFRKGFGVFGLECEEVIYLDEMSKVAEPYGIVFLYKWKKETNATRNLVTDENVLETLFFAKQVLFNVQDINLGTILKDLKEFGTSFDAQNKGLMISNSDKIRKVCNSFSNNKKYHGTENMYHFIVYMPIDGHLYELDGLQDGPIDEGAENEAITYDDNAIETLLIDNIDYDLLNYYESDDDDKDADFVKSFDCLLNELFFNKDSVLSTLFFKDCNKGEIKSLSSSNSL